MPSYLQFSLENLAKEQERFRKTFAGAFTPAGAFEAYQEQARKNLAMFEQAMAMFSPFGQVKRRRPPSRARRPRPKPEDRAGARGRLRPDELDELKTQLAAMQAKLEQLSRNRT